MLLTTHALAGAAIAAGIKNPLVSLPLAFIAHFLMDFIPHWDLGSNLEKRSKGKTFFLALIDGLIGLMGIFFLFQIRRPFSLLPWLGAAASLLPDFLEAPYVFLGFHLLAPIDHLHSEILHRQAKNIFIGLLPQAIIILAILSVRHILLS